MWFRQCDELIRSSIEENNNYNNSILVHSFDLTAMHFYDELISKNYETHNTLASVLLLYFTFKVHIK